MVPEEKGRARLGPISFPIGAQYQTPPLRLGKKGVILPTDHRYQSASVENDRLEKKKVLVI